MGEPPAPMAAPSPPEEPPAVRDGSYGLLVRPYTRFSVSIHSVSSVVLVRPRRFPPASSWRVAMGAVASQRCSRRATTPAQLGIPDMRVPIQYALTYPDRNRNPAPPRADWSAVGAQHFEAVDTERFRCLSLAFQAGRMGATYPTTMAAADEAAVPAFLAGLIRFGDIPGIIEDVLEKHVAVAVRSPDIAAIKWADAWARNAADELIVARRP